jgi:hypothetical protein
MSFKLLYLPAEDQTFTENCDIVYPDGSVSKCDTPIGHPFGGSKVAEAWIVDTLYNSIRKVAKPRPDVLRWLKQGDIVPPGTFWPEEIPESGKETLYHVRCPKCGKH